MRLVRTTLSMLALLGSALPGAGQPLAPATATGAWSPPACEGLFTDVPCGAQFAEWVEQFARDGITSGCRAGEYCPDDPVTRRQMAVFVERAMRGTEGWPPRTVLVHPVTDSTGLADPVQSGLALASAIALIPSTGADAPSQTNPWVVMLGPAVYDIGDTSLAVPAYVSVVGAGMRATVVSSATLALGRATVEIGSYAELRFLTVQNRGGESGESFAVRVTGDGARLAHVRIEASPGTNTRGLYARYFDDVTLDSVEVEVTGANVTGVGIEDGSFTLRDVRVDVLPAGVGCRGIDLSAADGVIDGCRISGELGESAAMVGLDITGGTLEVRNCQIQAGTRTTAHVMAVRHQHGTLELRDSYLFATQGAGGSGHTLALVLSNVDARVVNVTAVVDTARAVFASGTGDARTLDVRSSRLYATTDAVYGEADYALRVTHSDLGASVTAAGTATCLANTFGGSFFAATCP